MSKQCTCFECESLNTAFYSAYHGSTGKDVKAFLIYQFPDKSDNRHMESMIHFCNLIADSVNPNPFILGMLCEAWKQFLAECGH